MTAVDGALKQEVKQDLAELCKRARAGSVWCALLVAIETEPRDLSEFLRTVGVTATLDPVPVPSEHAFDAASDAWAVYRDALVQGVGV